MAPPCQILRIVRPRTTIACAFCLSAGLSLRTVILCCQSLPHLPPEIRFPKNFAGTQALGVAPTGSVGAVFRKTQDSSLLHSSTSASSRCLCPSLWVAASAFEVRTSHIPSHLHNCETCRPFHPSDSVKALSPHLEATFMRRPAALFFLLIFSATICTAQRRGPIHPPPATSAGAQSTGAGSAITLPASTKITVALTKAVFTASAQPGDAIYAVTSFPVVADTRMAIPPGTYVQGFVDTISRPSGRSPHAEFRLHFVQMVFADGYSVELYNTPLPSAASDGAAVSSDPVQQELLIEQGGLGGAPVADVFVNVSASSDVLLDNGTQFEIQLERPLSLDSARIAAAIAVSKSPRISQFKSATKCRFIVGTAGTPGTPDTVIAGSPGTPDTVIPGMNGAPDTVIPGISATPDTVIPGTPGTPGTPDTVCPGPPVVASAQPDQSTYSKSFPVLGALTLDGQHLTRGNYKATWTGAGDNVDVRLTRKKTPDIVVKAHVVNLPKKASKSIATRHANADGSQSLESVQFKGQTVALYFEQVSAGNSSPTANKPPGA